MPTRERTEKEWAKKGLTYVPRKAGRKPYAERFISVVNVSGDTKLLDKVEIRRNEVADMISDGKTYNFIKNELSKKYDVSTHSIQNDINLMMNDMKEYVAKNRNLIIGNHLLKYDRLYERCMEAKDYDTAIKVLNSKEKLLNLYKEVSPVTINQLSVNGYTTEQLLKIQETLSDE